MKILDYIKDKCLYIILNLITQIFILSLLILFKTNKLLTLFVFIMLILNFIIPLLIEYINKKIFYNNFKKNLEKLDKKYLITEMITTSNFLDGKLLLEYLYEIDKCMNEELKNYKNISNELKEYIELWCHEIKTPVSSSKLIIENNKNKVTESILEELDNIENYIEQVLFYSRSEIVEKDYIIKDTNLSEVINNVIKRNKKDLINKKIKIDINNIYNVKSDTKWLEFIINQIIINSIKYSKEKDSIISIYMKENKNNKILYIKDNGIGISNNDINKVFDKGFTGLNGRKKYNSTGIGLYLCKKLCIKLGLNIDVDSILNEYTTLVLTFPNNDLTNI